MGQRRTSQVLLPPLPPAGWTRRGPTTSSPWSGHGAGTEWEPLRRAALALPGSWCRARRPSERELIRLEPDIDLVGRQAAALAALLQDNGVVVQWVRPTDAGVNFLFLRDLWAMTPFGAVLARPAPLGRLGEEVEALRFLAEAQVPVLGSVSPPGTFEGADLVWVTPELALLGVGNRTDHAGASQVSGILAAVGVDVVQVSLRPDGQHLLGEVNVAGPDLAFVRGGGRVPMAEHVLSEAGFRVCPWPSGGTTWWAMNFLCLRAGVVVAPGPRSAAPVLDGVRVLTADVGEYLNACGGVACAVGIVERGTDG